MSDETNAELVMSSVEHLNEFAIRTTTKLSADTAALKVVVYVLAKAIGKLPGGKEAMLNVVLDAQSAARTLASKPDANQEFHSSLAEFLEQLTTASGN